MNKIKKLFVLTKKRLNKKWNYKFSKSNLFIIRNLKRQKEK